MVTRLLLVFSCFLSLAFHSTALGQFQQIRLELTVHDASDTTNWIFWGLDISATDGIDSALGEYELPPPPPEGHFDIRWINPPGTTVLGQGCSLDLRRFTSTAQIDTYRVHVQPSFTAYPMTIRWPRELVKDYYRCGARMVNYPGGDVINVDMTAVDSVLVPDASVQSLLLIMRCPLGANLISGHVFNDFNGDGRRNPGESGLAGWRVLLSGPAANSAVTDAEGFYEFTNLPNGTFTVAQEPREGWLQSTAPPAYTCVLDGGTTIPENNFGDFQLASVAGTVFNDANGNGARDSAEAAIAGWPVVLRGEAAETTLTDGAGHFSFTGIGPGSRVLSQVQDTNWVQIKPGAPGFYSITPTSGAVIDTFEFGNKLADRFTGAPGALWSDSSNWSAGHPPGAADAVVVTRSVTIDQLPEPQVLALRITSGGVMTYTTGDRLLVTQSVQIENGSTLDFGSPPRGARISAAGQNGMICEGDLIIAGELLAGSSVITLAGDRRKTIVASAPTGVEFFDLEIAGANTGSVGSFGVLDRLFLGGSLQPGPKDTLFILNPAANAIFDTGRIIAGTVSRRIAASSLDAYRFESPGSILKFDGSGSYPLSVAVTTVPDSLLASSSIRWQNMGGSVDSVNHTITIDSVTKFSKWPFGTPKLVGRAGKQPGLSSALGFGVPRVNRFYAISPDGGAGYRARLQLRYEESEIPPGLSESSLELLRGPIAADSVFARWNMISVPFGIPSGARDSLFPEATSDAFLYSSGSYQPRTRLTSGMGYWLKFPGDQEILMEGEERSLDTLPVVSGWNLIGALSSPLDVRAIGSIPPGNVVASIFGYKHGYTVADTLFPLRGYWVKVASDGELILDASISPGLARAAGFSGLTSGLNRLTVRDGAGNSGTLYFGANCEGGARPTAMPPPPPEGSFDVRFTTGTMAEFSAAERREVNVEVKSASPPVIVSWDIRNHETDDALRVGGETIPLTANGSIALADPGAAVTLLLAPLRSAGHATEFKLYQNYPNPFNPTTVIAYELPAAAHVTVTIHNLLGQKVKTLLDGAQGPGSHSVIWNSTNDEGIALSSSVYFCRIIATDLALPQKSFTGIRKMILLR